MLSLPNPLPPCLTIEVFGSELIELSNLLKRDHPTARIALLRRGKSNADWIATVYASPLIAKQSELFTGLNTPC